MVSKKEKEKLAEAEKSEADEEDLEKCNEGKKVEKTDPPEDADEEERMQGKKKKSIEKAEDEDEEEDEDKKKKKVKKAGTSENPEESSTAGASDSHTITPGLSVPSKAQDVFVPDSAVDGKREQSTPMGKSAEPDLLKSPLFVGIDKKLDAMQDALARKVDALNKSVDDRMKNIKSEMEKIEKFYTQSFYKAASENVGPEGVPAQTIAKQIEGGKLRMKG